MNVKKLLGYTFLGLALSVPSARSFADETIVMIRHGEKPDAGLGQLSCQGLNRALALPRVLRAKFDTPLAIFAPNPGVQKIDQGTLYNYIRPLATIEPTAIRLGLPVNTQYGFEDLENLQEALNAPAYRDATIIVAWEHRLLEQFARKLLSENSGDPGVVPVWGGYDFDGIFVITLKTDSRGQRTASFRVEAEALNKLSAVCPE